MRRAAAALGGALCLLCVAAAGTLAEPQGAPDNWAATHPERPQPAQPEPLEVEWLGAVAAFASRTGPYGVIAGLLYGMRVLWKEIKDRDSAAASKEKVYADAIKSRDDTIALIMQKRLDDGVENARRIEAVATTSAQLLSDNLRNSVEWTALLKAMKERNDGLVPIFESMTRKLDRNYRKIMRGEGDTEDAA